MKVITWNLRRANKKSPVWQIILQLQPDIALLQEVGEIPETVQKKFNILSRKALSRKGKPQNFSTVVLAKDKILGEIPLKSKYDWVNEEMELLRGNFVSCTIQLPGSKQINVVSVYSPPWPIDKEKLNNIDVSPVKLKSNSKIWGTEILWAVLKNNISASEEWIVGGDYNSSETFDKEWQERNRIRYGIRSSGNREILDRMHSLGLTECLRQHNEKIIPTFKHSRGEIAHQIDHLFVSNEIYSKLKECVVGKITDIFDNSLSDHLPIIADFEVNV